MQNTEWYKKTELDYDASGRWWADGYNEALSIGLSYGDDGVDVNFIDQLLAQHRKMIVKEIRGEILEDVARGIPTIVEFDSVQKGYDFCSSANYFLSLPCLKENE